MRVKEWHKIKVKGRPVLHDLEPTYYRQGKTNVRIDGVWYCTKCDDIVDMRRLTKQGFSRRPDLFGRDTSMFEKGLWFEKKPRLSGQVVEEIDDLEEDRGQRKEHKLETESLGKVMEEIRAYERSLLDKERELGAIEVPADLPASDVSISERFFRASPSSDSRAKARAKRKTKKKRR